MTRIQNPPIDLQRLRTSGHTYKRKWILFMHAAGRDRAVVLRADLVTCLDHAPTVTLLNQHTPNLSRVRDCSTVSMNSYSDSTSCHIPQESSTSSNSSSLVLLASDGEQLEVPMHLVAQSKVLQSLFDFQDGSVSTVPLSGHELRAHIQFDAKQLRPASSDSRLENRCIEESNRDLSRIVQVLHVRVAILEQTSTARQVVVAWVSTLVIMSPLLPLLMPYQIIVTYCFSIVQTLFGEHQAADYLDDDRTVSSAASALAEELFCISPSHPVSIEALDYLPENVALAVLRASALPLTHLFTRLPPAYHALALLATYPSIDYTSSLSLPIMDPCATRSAIRALSRFPHLSTLRFRPWMPLAPLLSTLHDLQALSNLVSLDMSHMHVSIPTAGAMVSALWHMPQLQSLDLSESLLGATGAAVLLPVAASMHTLRTLLLRGCGLQAAGTMARCMPLSPTLRMLDISHNRLGDRGARAVSLALSGNLHSRPMTHVDASSQYAFDALRGGCQLEWLDVSDNGCGTEGLLALCEALALLQCIREATLVARSDVKSLSDSPVAKWLQVLGPKVSCFRKLELGGRSERLSDMHVEALSPLMHALPSAGYTCMPTMCDLDLSYTELSIEWCTGLARALQYARALQSLKLVCCELGDASLEAVLLAIGSAPLLATLDLRGNALRLLSCAAAALVATLPLLSSLSNLSLCIVADLRVQGELQSSAATGPHISKFQKLLLTPRNAVHSIDDPMLTCPVALASDAIGAALCKASGASTYQHAPRCMPDSDMRDDACSSQHDMHAMKSQMYSYTAPLATLYLELVGLEWGHACSPAVERSLGALCSHLARLPNLQEVHMEHALTAMALSSLTRSPVKHPSSTTVSNRGHSSRLPAAYYPPALTALTSLNLSLIDDESSVMGMDRGLRDLAALISANVMLQQLVLGVFVRGSGRVIGEGAGRFAFSRALNSLVSLRHLDLCEEMCDEEFLRATFMHARFLSCLQELRLSIDGQCKIARVAEALAHGRVLHLRTLHMHGVHVSHACVAALLRYASQGPVLEELQFDSDWITEGVAAQMAPAIGSMQSLQVLCFARNPMRDRGVAEIARQLPRLHSLRTLSFCCCHMSSTGAVALSDHLTCLTRLQTFRLSQEFVGPMAMSQALAPALATLGALSVLQLHDNHVGDEGAAALGRWLQGHAALCHVALTSNAIMDAGAVALARYFRQMPALQRVNVTGNRFGEHGHAAMAALQVFMEDPNEVHW